MSCVTSRGFVLPAATSEMNGSTWFNLWSKRLWPFQELMPGSDLYWYESPSKAIVWRTRVTTVEAFPYSQLSTALDRLDRAFGGTLDRHQDYLRNKPESGYCLGYAVDEAKRLHLPKPADVRFAQAGWERADRPEIAGWINT